MLFDIKLGILWAILSGVLFDMPLSFSWFFGGVLFALLPDLDFWVEYAKRGTVGGKVLGAHRTLLHNPLLYIPIALFIGAAAGDAWMTLFIMGVLGHFVHDSLGMGLGVRWLWPFSEKFYKIFSDKDGNIHYDRAHLTPVSWTTAEVQEILKKKGNDNWLREDLVYHLKRWPTHLWKFMLLLVIVFAVWELWSQRTAREKTMTKPLPVTKEVCALPTNFLTFACSARENASLRGRDLIAPKRLEARSRLKAAVRLPFYEKYVPVPKGQNSNTLRLQKSQVPKPVSAKVENGKYVCKSRGDKPRRSKKNDRNHVDMQCCLDPDEIPNPYCDYSYNRE